MDEDDLREFELALDRHGALSGEDSGRLVAEVRRLRDALLAYGRHTDECVFWQDDDGDLAAYGEGGCCTCGFFDAKHP